MENLLLGFNNDYHDEHKFLFAQKLKTQQSHKHFSFFYFEQSDAFISWFPYNLQFALSQFNFINQMTWQRYDSVFHNYKLNYQLK